MLFDRVYRLLVGSRGSTRGFAVEAMRIQFDIKKSAKKSANRSTIHLWELRRSTREELEKPDRRCILYAGYRDDAGPMLIFQGSVVFAWSRYDAPSWVTELELGDGVPEMRDSMVSLGYAGHVRSTVVLQDVAQRMGLPLILPANAPEREWANGLSYYGNATGLLDKVTAASGLEWSVQNETIQVIAKGMVTTRQGIELALDSGMIHSPERVRRSATEARAERREAEGKPEYDGWRVRSLLMPMLNPGDRVKLNTRGTGSGVYRIQELTHKGDSHEGDWETELKLIDPAAPVSGEETTKGGVPRPATGLEDYAATGG